MVSEHAEGQKVKPEKAPLPERVVTKKTPPKGAKKTKTATTEGGPTRRQRIVQTMQTDPGKAWTAGEIATTTGDARRQVQATMSMMVQDNQLAKDDHGYRLPVLRAA